MTGIIKRTSRNQQLLAKSFSITGYISVAEDPNVNGMKIRVLRCDHSIIGGIFKDPKAWNESLFGVFYFLEFVHGFEKQISTTEVQNSDKRVLNMYDFYYIT
jgi:hypothetical protein